MLLGWDKLKIGFWAFWILCSSLAAERYLGMHDIARVTQQILSIHLQYHQLDEQLFAKMVKNYLEQSDPWNLYLLQSEVESYQRASREFFQKSLSQFQKGDYALFEEMDRMIQASIWRARQWDRLAGDMQQLEPFRPVTARAFTLQELKRRWGQLGSGRSALEREALRESIAAHEREWLYRLTDGSALAFEQKEHFFALHLLKALASSLDAHTAVFSAQEAQRVRDHLKQSYLGIGLWLEDQGGRWVVRRLIEKGPAEQCGKIQIGDELVGIGGHPVDKVLINQYSNARTGELIEWEFVRQKEPYRVTLPVQEIERLANRLVVSSRPCEGGCVGYIKIDSFYEADSPGGVSSQCDMRLAIEQLQAQAPLKALILDLRDNGGGLLNQAVQVAGLFIKSGVVALAKYRDGSVHYYRDLDPYQAFDGPLLVMTSRASASAAELLAQALQDYGIALVMGDHSTYAKGSIQAQNLLNSDSSVFYKVTVGRYYTVSGKTPQLRGVPIDLLVPGPLDREMIGEGYDEGALAADELPSSFNDSLADLSEQERVWLSHNYLPTLQKPSDRWKPLLPLLREQSERRLLDHFEKKAYEKYEREQLLQLQLDEAYAIARDMVGLSIEDR